MSILVVGSVAFDSIETPEGRRDRCLGGAATYFSLAASYFTKVRVIAVVGEDFTAGTRGRAYQPRGRYSGSGTHGRQELPLDRLLHEKPERGADLED